MGLYVRRETDSREHTMTLPPDILTAAQATRATFGQGVKLLFVADHRTGESKGNPAWDDPCSNDNCRGISPRHAPT